jgi:hypothetical protein
VRISGKVLLRLLENSVSIFPKASGRNAVISGLSVKFDLNKEVGNRLLEAIDLSDNKSI